MKKHAFIVMMLISYSAVAQVSIDQILQAGVEDAQRFSQDYFAPAGEGVVNAMSNGWYSTAAVKELFHFEIGLVTNGSFVRDEKKSFVLNEDDYNNLSFRDGEEFRQEVANAFGENGSDVVMVVNGAGEITLPDGFGGTGVNFMPTVFLQGSVGLIKGTEIKARFWPKISGKAKVQLYGVAFQHELTQSVFSWKRSPVRISGIIGYTNLTATYDLSEDSSLEGAGQEVGFRSNSWLVSGIFSTKLPVLNFYGGFGYFSGNSRTGLDGTYVIADGTEFNDPVSVKHKESGLKATIGTRVALGFFKANLDYTLQNYNTLSLGLHVGW